MIFNNKINQHYSYKNRGMFLEELINKTNIYYAETDVALINKKATPIKIISTNQNYVTGVFNKKSTTDYAGVYCGHYIDFDVKQTKELKYNFNIIPIHQIKHLKKVFKCGGIAFFLLYFEQYHETYFIPIEQFPYNKILTYKEINNLYLQVETNIYIKYISTIKIYLKEY